MALHAYLVSLAYFNDPIDKNKIKIVSLLLTRNDLCYARLEVCVCCRVKRGGIGVCGMTGQDGSVC